MVYLCIKYAVFYYGVLGDRGNLINHRIEDYSLNIAVIHFYFAAYNVLKIKLQSQILVIGKSMKILLSSPKMIKL